ncbi:MAG TPA: protein-L-isoaspartate O-methyltransferase [Sphingobium sp.]|uniref:protein-L-isoaspartate O-methyltransferase family protein n=1 Tax=Sphingobium sp. TaxID=1912891 RepID=UPI002ED091B4
MTEQNFTSMRRAMVESQLRTNDVNDVAVIRAILSVPREDFVPEERRAAAYIDRAVPLLAGRALNPPLATARLLTEARVEAGQSVLLVGAATGYAAALLAEMGARVTALESDAALATETRARLSGKADVTVVEGPLEAGVPAGAPYDVLFIDGAVELLSDALIGQVKVGGRVVFARIDNGVTRLCSGLRTAGGFGATAFSDAEAVALPGFAAPKSFRF